MHMPELETPRLRLRPFTPDDMNALFAILSDRDANTFVPWFPAETVEDARAFYQERFADPTGYAYAVCLKADNVPIGYVTLDGDGGYDLGYGYRKAFWHKGIATEAAQAVVAQAKKDRIPFVTATHDVKNSRSGAVMQRLGMRYQYSYKEQWQPKNLSVIFRLYQMDLDDQTRPAYSAYWDRSTVRFIESLA